MPKIRRIVGFLLLIAAVFAVPSSASAMSRIPGCEGEPTPVVESTADGMQGYFDAPLGWTPQPVSVGRGGNSDTTRYELVTASYWQEIGIAGMGWHTIRDSCIDHMADAPISGIANLMWLCARGISLVSITLYEWAASGDALSGLETLVVAGVEGLRRAVWGPFLAVVVVLGAVWMGWWGLVRQRPSVTVEGAAWMVAATVLGVWVVSSPGTIVDTAGRATLLGADIAHIALGPVRAAATGAPECPADRGGVLAQGADSGWSGREITVQTHAENLWSGLVCRPWIAGQFGNSEAGRVVEVEFASDLIAAQSVGRSTTHHIADGRLNATAVYESKAAGFEDLSERLEEDHPQVYPLYAGDRPWDRVGVAGMALVASICAGGLLFIVALSSLVAQMAFFLLLLLAPVFCVLGVHPGRGRTLLIRWVETTLGILLRQIVLHLLLMLLVEVYITILGWEMSWGGQMVVLTLATLALLLYRRRLTDIVSSVTAQTAPHRAGAQVVRAGVAGAVGGAGAAGLMGARGARGAPGREGASGSVRRGRVSWRKSGGQGQRRPGRGAGAGQPQQRADRPTGSAGQQRPADPPPDRASGPGRGHTGRGDSADPGGSGRRRSTWAAPRLPGRDPSPPAHRDPSPRPRDGGEGR
ncbi:hypothetical protein LG943_00740 [Streptomonospora sp. S1-112]|uniref:TrbL/VirB6 plasmid conjugal transfer protein n=1 Tax=Streptomonospora mangrovi TaxID=2883123 RepID=A0A9X3NGZ5_9ACTN|nr:hypothetical protein [Streptomonospora mangrovi]MDA0562870.1 hypothetical protein [Streptomonospora mangrovi]